MLQYKKLLPVFSMNAVDDLYKKQMTKNDLKDRRKRLSELLLMEKQEHEVS